MEFSMQHALKFSETDEKSHTAPAKPVPYDFPADPANWNGIALIGEAPGAEEVRLGHPFVGRSGQLLDKMLEKTGIDRKKCFVGNAFRFQPPGNKVDHFFISRRAAANGNLPLAEEWGQFGSAWCRSEFAAELENLRAIM